MPNKKQNKRATTTNNTTSGFKEYKDGLGKSLPNEDLILSQEAKCHTLNKMLRSVRYQTVGRSGKAIYCEGEKSLSFEMEMCGGDAVFMLFIPGLDEWEVITGFPITRRMEILSFLAECTKRDQGPSTQYIIEENAIIFKK